MKRKKGFLSTSILYSFFIIFLLIMLSMLADYMNKRFLLRKNSIPVDSPCEDGAFLDECLRQIQDDKGTLIPGDPELDEKGCVKTAGMYSKADDYTDKKTATNGYGDSNYYTGNVEDNYAYFGGYIWRIVRINGNNTVRLIYSGEAQKDANGQITLKPGSKPYIDSDYYGVSEKFSLTRFNYSMRSKSVCTTDTVLSYDNVNLSTTCDSLLKGVTSYYAPIKCWSNLLEKYQNDRVEIEEAQEKFIYENGSGYKCSAATLPKTCMADVNARLSLNEAIGNVCASGLSKNVLGECYIQLLAKIDAKIKEIDNKLNGKNGAKETFVKNCLIENENESDSTLIGAYMPNRIGYMNNWYADLARYDSEYDNQNSSEIKTYVDDWFKNWKSTLSSTEQSLFSNETIFCGDKKETSNNVYAKNRIAGNGATYKCPDTGGSSWSMNRGIARFNLVTGKEKIWFVGRQAINLSRYNVGANQIIYSFFDEYYTYPKINKTNLYDLTKGTRNAYYYYFKTNSTSLSDKTGSKATKIEGYVPNITNSNWVKYWSNTQNKYIATSDFSKNNIIKVNSSGLPEQYLGNGALDYPVALLSADEAYLAGLRYDSKYSPSHNMCDSYLIDEMSNSQGFWTMTLSETDIIGSDAGATYFVVSRKNGTEGWLEDKDDTKKRVKGYYMRPVINIKRTKTFCVDDTTTDVGTINNPIIIGETCGW